MADEPKHAIDPQAVTQWMDSREDKYTCPICGNTNWMGMSDEFGRTGGLIWVSPNEGIETRAVRVVPMFCTKCGFTRMHELSIFRQYIQEAQNGKK